MCVCVAHTELVPVLLFNLRANFALKTCSSVYIIYNSTCGINAKIYNKKPDACVLTRIANYFSTKKNATSLIIRVLRAQQVHRKVLLHIFVWYVYILHNYNIKSAKQVWMDRITGLGKWNKINTKLKFPMVFVNSVCTVLYNEIT